MGTYTQIVAIIAPDSALPGATVNVEVQIKNLYTGVAGLSPAAKYDNNVIDLTPPDANVNPGATQSFYASFIMPSSAVVITVYSWYYGADGGLYYDNEMKTKSISLAALTPAISQFQISDYAKV